MESPTTYDEILKFIVYKCRESNSPVAEALVAFLLNIAYDEADDQFYFAVTDKLSIEKADVLIKKIMALINTKGNGTIETLNLQVTYELAHIEEEDKVEQLKIFFDDEINSLIREITSYQTSNKKDNDSIIIHKKILNFLLIKTRQITLDSLNSFSTNSEKSLGTPSEKEIYAALDNVLPKTGLPPFISLSSQDKISQLNELCNIIMGIRLINRELGKGGLGLHTLAEIKMKLGTELLNEVKDYYQTVTDTCHKYISVYESIDIEVLDDGEFDHYDKIRKYIIYYRQILTYLSMLTDDLHNSAMVVENLAGTYDKEVKYLMDLFEKKSAISKEQVYPRFENLAKLYTKFQEQTFINDIRENVFHKLQNYVNSTSISINYSDKVVGKWANNTRKENEEEPVFEFDAGPYQNGVTILLPHSTADFMDIKLEYQGFCIITLLKRPDLLLNGKPSVVTKFKDKYMVFNSQSEIQDFIDDPDNYLTKIHSYVKKNPYLINLLNMTDEFPMANLSILFRDKDMYTYKYKSSSIKVDKGFQTLVHVYEENFKDDEEFPNINPNYVWNEWDMKKNALQLADIMKKKTISCQTNLSHFRRDNETQVWIPKDEAINTTVNKGTNISIPKAYVPGLRKYDNKY